MCKATKKNEILRLVLTKKDLLFMASPFRPKLNMFFLPSCGELSKNSFFKACG